MCRSVRRCKSVVHTVSTSCRRPPVLKLYRDISTWATMHGTRKGRVLYSIRGTIHIDCNKCTLKVQHTLYNHTLQPSSGGRICVTGQWTVTGHSLYTRRPSRLGAPAVISADRISILTQRWFSKNGGSQKAAGLGRGSGISDTKNGRKLTCFPEAAKGCVVGQTVHRI